jgi:hypothetical protein
MVTARPSHPGSNDRPAVVWEGPQWPIHAFALSNREFCLRILARARDLTIIPTGSRGEGGGRALTRPELPGSVRRARRATP